MHDQPIGERRGALSFSYFRRMTPINAMLTAVNAGIASSEAGIQMALSDMRAASTAGVSLGSNRERPVTSIYFPQCPRLLPEARRAGTYLHQIRTFQKRSYLTGCCVSSSQVETSGILAEPSIRRIEPSLPISKVTGISPCHLGSIS